MKGRIERRARRIGIVASSRDGTRELVKFGIWRGCPRLSARFYSLLLASAPSYWCTYFFRSGRLGIDSSRNGLARILRFYDWESEFRCSALSEVKWSWTNVFIDFPSAFFLSFFISSVFCSPGDRIFPSDGSLLELTRVLGFLLCSVSRSPLVSRTVRE